LIRVSLFYSIAITLVQPLLKVDFIPSWLNLAQPLLKVDTGKPFLFDCYYLLWLNLYKRLIWLNLAQPLLAKQEKG